MVCLTYLIKLCPLPLLQLMSVDRLEMQLGVDFYTNKDS